MKLFGRKTLALLLALTMMLSLCSFTAFAGNENGGQSSSTGGETGGETGGTTGGGTGTGETPPAQKTLQSVALKSGETAPVVGFGTTEAEVKTKLAALKFTFTYSDNSTENDQTIASWSCSSEGGYKATVPGSYTFTGDVGLNNSNPTVSVTVEAVKSVDLAAPSSVENDLALTSVSAVDKLPKNFTARFDTAAAKTLTVTDYYTWSLTAPASYGSGVLVPNKYTYTATPKSE